jgi:hypothetical protein
LRGLLTAHAGQAPVRIRMLLPEGQWVTIAPNLSVTADDRFRQAVEEAFGVGSVTFR